MDWLEALAEVAKAAVRYQKAFRALEAAEWTKDADALRFLRANFLESDALTALADAAMLLPLGDDETPEATDATAG